MRTAEPHDKLCCELAYTGTLFWLPLLACPERPDARYHANQGLWLLVLSVASCAVPQIVAAGAGVLSGALGAILGVLHAACIAVIVPWMLYLTLSAVKSALCIHRGEGHLPILFFDRHPLIQG